MYLARRASVVLMLVAILACARDSDESPEPSRETIAIQYVGESELPIHEAPDASSPVVTTYRQGETVSIVARRDGWTEIRLAKGTGWVPDESLSTEMTSADEAEGASTTVRFKDAPSPVYTQSRTKGEIVLEGTRLCQNARQCHPERRARDLGGGLFSSKIIDLPALLDR
jgi:uncharacterized protein YgiM (DUF1202 family)